MNKRDVARLRDKLHMKYNGTSLPRSSSAVGAEYIHSRTYNSRGSHIESYNSGVGANNVFKERKATKMPIKLNNNRSSVFILPKDKIIRSSSGKEVSNDTKTEPDQIIEPLPINPSEPQPKEEFKLPEIRKKIFASINGTQHSTNVAHGDKSIANDPHATSFDSEHTLNQDTKFNSDITSELEPVSISESGSNDDLAISIANRWDALSDMKLRQRGIIHKILFPWVGLNYQWKRKHRGRVFLVWAFLLIGALTGLSLGIIFGSVIFSPKEAGVIDVKEIPKKAEKSDSSGTVTAANRSFKDPKDSIFGRIDKNKNNRESFKTDSADSDSTEVNQPLGTDSRIDLINSISGLEIKLNNRMAKLNNRMAKFKKDIPADSKGSWISEIESMALNSINDYQKANPDVKGDFRMVRISESAKDMEVKGGILKRNFYGEGYAFDQDECFAREFSWEQLPDSSLVVKTPGNIRKISCIFISKQTSPRRVAEY